MSEPNRACGGGPASTPEAITEWDWEQSKVEILILEDDPEIGRYFQTKLADPKRTIFVVQTMKLASQILDENDIDLILLDLTLPDADGRSFLRQVRENPRTSTVPIIVISGRRGPVTKTECFELGADEYFEKPVALEMLAAAVGAKIKRAAELARRARYDVLTGLLNRIAFQEVFHRTQALSRRVRSSLALAILDLDKFKSINDMFGHPLGDRVLIRAAQIITRALRRSDVVGRWGGDEFVVLLPETDRAGAHRALDTVRQALWEDSFETAGPALKLSFSAGVVEVTDGTTLEDTVAEADRLLYQAKAEKRTMTEDRVPTIQESDVKVEN
jgi:diguanylate cyclase (GGDEF)-like protein